jgi:hypothetical protein
LIDCFSSVKHLDAFNRPQAIPPFAVPLRLGEPELVIELQPLLHRVFDRVRFELAIDMQQPPNPKVTVMRPGLQVKS